MRFIFLIFLTMTGCGFKQQPIWHEPHPKSKERNYFLWLPKWPSEEFWKSENDNEECDEEDLSCGRA